jgi:hypothetical protein
MARFRQAILYQGDENSNDGVTEAEIKAMAEGWLILAA